MVLRKCSRGEKSKDRKKRKNGSFSCETNTHRGVTEQGGVFTPPAFVKSEKVDKEYEQKEKMPKKGKKRVDKRKSKC